MGFHRWTGMGARKTFTVLLASTVFFMLLIGLFSFTSVHKSLRIELALPTGPEDEDVLKAVCAEPFDPRKVQIAAQKPRIYVYPNFLTDEECDHIIQLGLEAGLQRSQVAAVANDTTSEVRTSYGTFLQSVDPVLQRIEGKIAVWTHIPVENGEQFYLLRYEKGQQYKPHYDYFDTTKPGMERYVGAAGQRTATILLYLATPEEGGETVFPRAQVMVPAVRGTAVLFYSHTLEHELDPNSFHGGMPVISGTKYCMTKWIRENRWG